MQHFELGFRVGVWSSRDSDDRQVFCISARNGIQQAQAPHTKCYKNRAGAARGTTISVSGITGIQFVTAGNHLQVLVFQQPVQQHQIVVSRDCEIMLQTNFFQSGSQIRADGSAVIRHQSSFY